MKKFLLGLMLLASAPSFAKTINDSTCEIAIPNAFSVFGMGYTIEDEALNTLINKGYTPYVGYPSQGLLVDWGLQCERNGERCIARASLKIILSNGRMALLHPGKTTSTLRKALRSFPKCKLK